MTQPGLEEDRDDLVERLVIEVMEIERQYGHELRNVKAEKHGKIREVIETLSRVEL